MKTFNHLRENELIWYIYTPASSLPSIAIIEVYIFDSFVKGAYGQYISCHGGFLFTMPLKGKTEPVVVFDKQEMDISYRFTNSVGILSTSPVFAIKYLKEKRNITIENIVQITLCGTRNAIRETIDIPQSLSKKFLSLRTYQELLEFKSLINNEK